MAARIHLTQVALSRITKSLKQQKKQKEKDIIIQYCSVLDKKTLQNSGQHSQNTFRTRR